MDNTISDLRRLLQNHHTVVVVTVASTRGSTPREPGAKMLIAENEIAGTIGGGHLELKAMQIARNMLAVNLNTELKTFSLGAGLGQCCGGMVSLFFEVVTKTSAWPQAAMELMESRQEFIRVIPTDASADIPAMLVTKQNQIGCDEPGKEIKILVDKARSMLEHSEGTGILTIKKDGGDNHQYLLDPVRDLDFKLLLFGAGHVGQALTRLLADQPCHVTWVDNRDDQLPGHMAKNILPVCTDTPEAIIDEAAKGSYFLVMTHDHRLDEKLAEQILRRDDYAYFGLIGSLTKRKKFEQRLLQRGINTAKLSRMTCPIGISGIRSKRPEAIALAVTAELLQQHEKNNPLTKGSEKNETAQGFY